MDHQYELAYGESIGYEIDVVQWPHKAGPRRLYRKGDGIGQTPCSYERYLVIKYWQIFKFVTLAQSAVRLQLSND